MARRPAPPPAGGSDIRPYRHVWPRSAPAGVDTWLVLRRFVVLFLPLLALGTQSAFPGVAGAAGGYVNPFSTPDYYVGRTDMGVDLCLAPGDPIGAVGDGVIVGVQKNWSEKQPYLWYELTSGPDAGRFVYVAEQITNLAPIGQPVTAGETIATYAKKGTCIETGWATPDGETLAVATTGYTEGEVTTAGISFARFLVSLGLQGTFELTAPKAKAAPGKHQKPAPKTTSRAGSGRVPTSTPTSHRTVSRPPTSSHNPSGGASSAPTDSGGASSSGVPSSGSSSGSSGGSGLP